MDSEQYVLTAEADESPELFDQGFHDAVGGHSPATSQPEHYAFTPYGLHA